MTKHEKINYLEFPAKDLAQTKAFFSAVFDWSFTDYGAEYTAFTNQGLDGGFFQSDLCSLTSNGSALVVFFSENLGTTEEKIKQAGGKIVRPVFSFPGGSRLHFADPSGNEFEVWSDS